jgi:putative ABC transport system permease protein
MSTLGKDLRYGIRALARTPAFTLIAIATLALAIGATSSLFTPIRWRLGPRRMSGEGT